MAPQENVDHWLTTRIKSGEKRSIDIAHEHAPIAAIGFSSLTEALPMKDPENDNVFSFLLHSMESIVWGPLKIW